jgi:hypothetical protein
MSLSPSSFIAPQAACTCASLHAATPILRSVVARLMPSAAMYASRSFSTRPQPRIPLLSTQPTRQPIWGSRWLWSSNSRGYHSDNNLPLKRLTPEERSAFDGIERSPTTRLNNDGMLGKRIAECMEGEPTSVQLRRLAGEIHANTASEREHYWRLTRIFIWLSIIVTSIFYTYTRDPTVDVLDRNWKLME